MYGEDDLDAAVEAGIVPAQTARAFRDFVARRRSSTVVDEEHFRLLTGFNDIFVAVAAILVLVAVGWLGGTVSAALSPVAVAAASWALAEYFTRRRRMALPSILLLLSFAGAVFIIGIALFTHSQPGHLPQDVGMGVGAAGLLTGAAATAHWWRFRVPITVAAGALAVLGTAAAVLMKVAAPVLGSAEWLPLLFGGLILFALAMWWDASDRNRSTRRSDVAFWLHLVAAPLIVHPVFSALGLLDGSAGMGRAAIGVALYLGLAVVALVVDRRALLISALVYVLYAIATLLKGATALSDSFGLTALVLGSALLLLSASWHRVRALLVRALPPAVQARLPAC